MLTSAIVECLCSVLFYKIIIVLLGTNMIGANLQYCIGK